MDYSHEYFLEKAIALAVKSVKDRNGGPFGCVVVKDGDIIAEGSNEVTNSNDPTAHAEVSAIRLACKQLNYHQLTGCIIYTSCEPCPMCLGAIYWARPLAVFYASSKQDASLAGFDDSFIYNEISVEPQLRSISMQQIAMANSKIPFEKWKLHEGKTTY